MLKESPSFGLRVGSKKKKEVLVGDLNESDIIEMPELPENSFQYLRPPVPSLTMTQSRESFHFMIKKLSDLAEDAKTFAKLPADNPEKLVFEYRHQILIQLFCSSNRGLLDLDILKERLFQQYGFKVIEPKRRQAEDKNLSSTELQKLNNNFSDSFLNALMQVIDELEIAL